MFDVFISHSAKNGIIADALKHRLESSSIRCWKAPDNILPGQVWEEAITDAISLCKATLLVWSKESQTSQQVKRELTLSASLGKVIIPFRIEDIKPEGTFAYYLSNTHWLDAFSKNEENAIIEAVDRIKKILDAFPQDPITDSSLQHYQDESSQEAGSADRQETLRVLDNILLSHTPVSNPVATQALLDQALHDIDNALAGSVEAYGYLTVPKRSNSTNQYDIHFCSAGIVITTGGDTTTIIHRQSRESFELDGADIAAGSTRLKIKGLKKRALEELVSAMNTWCKYDIRTSRLAMEFFDKYKAYFPAMSADDFYPFCSGGIAEAGIVTPLENGPPLVSFDTELKLDSGEIRFVGITFYRHNVVLCADNQDGSEMEFAVLALDSLGQARSQHAEKLIDAVASVLDSLSNQQTSSLLLERIFADWAISSEKINLEIS